MHTIKYVFNVAIGETQLNIATLLARVVYNGAKYLLIHEYTYTKLQALPSP